MTRFTRTLLVATILAGASLATVAPLQAGCGGSHRSWGYRPPVRYVPRPVYSQPAPTYSQPIAQPIAQPAAPPQVPGQPPVQSPAQPPVQPTQPAAPAAASPQGGGSSGSAPGNAQLSALQALAGMTAGAGATAPAAQTPASGQLSPVGVWNAQLANGARVQLKMQADGSFTWSATNQSGRTSSFAGSYTMANGSLTLVRSNDNQKLAGAITSSGANAFNFKLSGAKDQGLSFVRG